MKFLVAALCLVLFIEFATSAPAAPGLNELKNSTIDQLVCIVKRLQNMGQGMPQVTNVTQRIVEELAQIRQSRLFVSNPCSLFQSTFRTFYCTVSTFDPERSNPIVQGLLPFLGVNQMFYNFASNFFCPFGGGSSSRGGAINCANSTQS